MILNKNNIISYLEVETPCKRCENSGLNVENFCLKTKNCTYIHNVLKQ